VFDDIKQAADMMPTMEMKYEYVLNRLKQYTCRDHENMGKLRTREWTINGLQNKLDEARDQLAMAKITIQ